MLITGAAIIYSRCFWLQMMRWWSIWHVNLQQRIYQKFFPLRSNQLWRQCSVWYDCEVWAVGDSCQGCVENVIISVTNVQINNTTLSPGNNFCQNICSRILAQRCSEATVLVSQVTCGQLWTTHAIYYLGTNFTIWLSTGAGKQIKHWSCISSVAPR